MILGSPMNQSVLIQTMQNLSTEIHNLIFKSAAFLKTLNQLTDTQLQDIFTDGGSATAAADMTAYRTWQSSLQTYVDNYSGNGIVSDTSYEISKRALTT